MALVVYNSRRTSAQARRQIWPMAAYLLPQGPSSKALRAASNGIRDGADEIGRDLDAIQLAQVPDDLARAHAPGIHRDYFVVEAGKAALILGDQLRVEGGLPVARDLQI